MKVFGLHHVSINSSNLDRSTVFYTALGLEPIPGANEYVRWFRLGRNELHLILSLNPIPHHRNESDPHFALEVDDIHAMQSLISNAGGEILQEPRQRAHDASWYLFALDPDGNRFEITQHAEDWHLRHALVDELVRKKVITQCRVAGALLQVPRHLFLPNHTIEQSYKNDAIMTKQEGEATSSASQPAMVTIMLEQLDLQPGQKVLEIGAGTGWNAALMSHLVGPQGHITTIDIDEDTVAFARENLKRAGVTDVEVICTDGGFGHPPRAPYDAIIATVGISDISPHWLAQLREGGRFLAPLWFNTLQFCAVFTKEANKLVSHSFQYGAFMPLRGDFAGKKTSEIKHGITISSDDMLQIDAAVMGELLQTPARQVCLLTLKDDNNFKCVEYLALCGESLASVQLLQPSGPSGYYAFVPSEKSMILLEGVWWEHKLAHQATVYGDDSSLLKLQQLTSQWQSKGSPSLSEAKIVVASPGTLPPQANVCTVRKQWMEYHISFETPHSQ